MKKVKDTHHHIYGMLTGNFILISFPWQFVNKSILHLCIGSLWVKLIGTGSKEYICVIKKFGVLKFQFHILQKLLIGRCFLYHKMHILAVAFKRLFNIYISMIQRYLYIKKISSLLSLIQSSKFRTHQFVKSIGCYLTFTTEPLVVYLERNFVESHYAKMLLTVYLYL